MPRPPPPLAATQPPHRALTSATGLTPTPAPRAPAPPFSGPAPPCLSPARLRRWGATWAIRRRVARARKAAASPTTAPRTRARTRAPRRSSPCLARSRPSHPQQACPSPVAAATLVRRPHTVVTDPGLVMDLGVDPAAGVGAGVGATTGTRTVSRRR